MFEQSEEAGSCGVHEVSEPSGANEPPPVRVPADLVARWGADASGGSRWLESLPGLVDGWCRRWSLDRGTGPALHGTNALVVPVRRGGQACVLKLAWRGGDPAEEVTALRAWDGRGAVRLLDADQRGTVLLLERLDPHRSLADVDLATAAGIAGHLIRRLAVPAPSGVPRTAATAANIVASVPLRQAALGYPVPAACADTAVDAARQLAGSGASALVHTDLHWGNVLAGTREPWLAIDPKPASGDPERSVPELLWTRADEVADAAGLRALLSRVVDAGRLDPHRARAWVVARTVDYWLWGVGVGLTEDPPRCARVLAAVVG